MPSAVTALRYVILKSSAKMTAMFSAKRLEENMFVHNNTLQ